MKINKEKVKTIALVVLGAVVVLLGLYAYGSVQVLEKEKNKLTAKDAEIQQLDLELGVAKSNLLDANELNRRYQDDLDNFEEEFKKKIDEYELKLLSKDKTIASLKNKVKGGKTKVVIGGKRNKKDSEKPVVIVKSEGDCKVEDIIEQVISYEWEEDKYNRFKLEDPDIFVAGNETFTSNQHLVVVGHVLQGKDGNLQIKKVEIKEVVPNGRDSEGNVRFKEVEGSAIELVDSQFDYTNTIPQKRPSLLDTITLRPFGSFNTAIMPGVGIELINVGRYFDFANIGLNLQLSSDLTDPLGGSFQNSQAKVGVHYHLMPPFLDTNFAVGASVGVPFNNLGSPVFTLDLILFLTDDLSPF